MIYIFQGCGMACKAPCYCCKAVGEAFDGMCKGCSNACGDCTKAISDCWAPIVQNPLGAYVIITWFTMLLVVGCCAATIPDASRFSCNELMMFCGVEIGIAIIHAVFAFYVQTRLVSALTKTGKTSMTHAEITTEAKNIAKFDIGFCLYFFFFIAAFGYNFYGVGWNADCNGTYYQKGAVGLLLCYGVCAWHYAICWYCGQCCFGKAEKRNIIKTHGGGVMPQSVGAPA